MNKSFDELIRKHSNLLVRLATEKLDKDMLRMQKKITKRNDKLLKNINRAHKKAGNSKLIFKKEK
jgi:hypothetical protein